MNNIHHSDFIVDLVKIFKPKSYLELGLYEGETLLKVAPLVECVVGVDIKNMIKRKPPNVELITTDTDSFFKNNVVAFDMIFIDANHNYDQVKIDLQNSLKFLKWFGVILLHDTDPEEEKLFDEKNCSNSYKILEDLNDPYAFRDALCYVTLPITECGLTIVRRQDSRRCRHV